VAQILLHGDDARQALGRGIAKLARAVRGTLGPRGMNTIINRPQGTPMISRDGASIAREIETPARPCMSRGREAVGVAIPEALR
jgi:chaperonin GroEL